MSPIKLLIIDDEPSILHAFGRIFRGPGYVLQTAGTSAEGLAAVRWFLPDVIVLDIHLPDATGLETLLLIKEIDARIPVVLVTGHGTTDLAIEAMKHGAFDYLLKPLELSELRQLIDQAGESSRLMQTPAMLPEIGSDPEKGDTLVGRCPGMQSVYKAIGRVASTDATVLILGESGTGKELIARAVYQHSRRKDKSFLAVNCAAIPEALLESELFGHEKGAFTGAERRRIGKFEQCSGGTILLDEVGDMSPLTQAKVLRLIQDQQFERLGGNETVRTDVRLIAATNRDLEKMVEEGEFRKDLFFRLNVFSIRLPALRDRGDDLPILVEHYLSRFAVELGRPVPTIHPAVWEYLRKYSWPGNIRELQSVLKQTFLQMRGAAFMPEDLPANIRGSHPEMVPVPGSEEGAGLFDWEKFVAERIHSGTQDLHSEALAVMEREVFVRVLRHTGGNQVQASKILGITRGSLRQKIKSLGITIERTVWSEDDQSE